MQLLDIFESNNPLLQEASRIGREYQHLEDLLITDGSLGGIDAVAELKSIAQQPGSMNMKWDGGAAVFWGRDSQGNFVFAPNNQWSKGQKLDREGLATEIQGTGRPRQGQTPEEFAAIRQGMADNYLRLWDLFEKATPQDFRGYLNGDLMFSERQTPGPDGYYEFTPNKVTYRVSPRGLYGKMKSAEAFVAVHGKIDEFGAEATGNLTPVPEAEIQRFNKTRKLIVLPTQHPTVQLKPVDQEAATTLGLIKNNATAIDTIANYTADRFTGFKKILYDYAVKRAKSDGILTFEVWLKDSKLSEKQKQITQEVITTHAREWKIFWTAFDAILKLKHDVLEDLHDVHSKHMDDKLGITAITAGSPGGEGYVKPMASGGMGKLVNPKFRSAPDNPRFTPHLNEAKKAKPARDVMLPPVFSPKDGDIIRLKRFKVDDLSYPGLNYIDLINNALKIINDHKLNLDDYPNIVELLDVLKPHLINWIQTYIANEKNPVVVPKLIKNLKGAGINWPEIDHALAEHKTEIIKILLKRIYDGATKMSNTPWADQSGKLDVAKDAVEFLKQSGVQWPELDTMQKSLRHKSLQSNLNEDDDVDTAKSKIYLNKDGYPHRLDGPAHIEPTGELRWFVNDINLHAVMKDFTKLTNITYPWKANFISRARINRNKKEILKFILTTIKFYQTQMVAGPMVHALKTAGIKWPELDMIQKSIDHDDNNSHLNESVPGAASKRNTIDWIKHLDGVLNVGTDDNIFFALGSIGKKIDYLPRKFPSITRRLNKSKDKIIKTILENLRDGNENSYLEGALKALKMFEITWPELAIINKSLEHEKNKITESDEDEQAQIDAVNRDGWAIRFINNPSEQLQLAAVNESGWAIQYIKNPNEQVQLAAVKQIGSAIRFIENPSEHVQLAAVKQDGSAIDYIENPSEQVKLAAVEQDGEAIRYIENPSEQVQIAAVKKDGWVIDNIDDPSINVLNKCKHEIIKSILTDIKDSEFELASKLTQKVAKTNWPELAIINKSLDHEKNKITESVEDEQAQLAAVNGDGLAIQFIKNPSEQLQLAAVNESGWAIRYIKNPSEQVQLAAVEQDGWVISYIKNPSESVQLAAVKQDGYVIRFIKNPSINVLNKCKHEIIKSILTDIKDSEFELASKLTQKAAKADWPELEIIKRSLDHEKNKITESDEDEQAQIAAVKQNGFAIQYIKNPSESVQIAAVKKDGYVIQYIENPSEQVQLAAVKQNGSAIRFIENPSEHVQLAAVEQDGSAIRYIKNPSEQVQLAAVKQDTWALTFIKNPSESAQLAAVKQDGYAIRFIKNPSEQAQIAAVKQDGLAIRFINDPSIYVLNKCKHEIIKAILIGLKDSNFKLASKLTQKVAKTNWPELAIINKSLDHEKNKITESVEDEQVQLAAVKQDGYAIRYIENPSEQVQLAAVKQDGYAIRYIENPSEQVQLTAVNKSGFAIRYIENPSESVQIAAVNRDGYAIRYIKNPSEQVQLAAVEQNSNAIEYIKNPSESVQLADVNKDGFAIRYIEHPSESVQLAAVKQYGRAIRYIENPSEQVQIAAVNQNGWAIEYIKNPSEQVQLAAVEQDGEAIRYIKNPSINVLNKCKHEIIKAILIGLKDSEFELASKLIQKAAKTNWPELAIIKRSLDHEKNKITESVEDEQAQIAAVKQNGNAIRYIKNPSEQVQIAAVKQNGFAIQYIKHPSEQVQLAAVNQTGTAIEYIENPSEQVQLAAVKQYCSAIRYIENPSESAQLAAVKQDGYVIRFINDPSINVLNKCKREIIKTILIGIKVGEFELASKLTQKVAKTNWPELAIISKSLDHEKNKITESVEDEQAQIAAVERNSRAIQHIKNPSEQAQLAAVNRDGWAIRYIKNPSEQVQLVAVKQDGSAIDYIKNPSEQVQLAAVKQYCSAIRYIKNPCEQVQLTAVNKSGFAIQYIKNPSESVQLAAVEQSVGAIRFITNPCEQAQIAAVKQNGYVIQYIENPCESVQLTAVKQNGWAIGYIKNPSESVQLEAVKQYVTAIRFINDPSIYVLNKCKHEIIKAILIGLKAGNFKLASKLIQKAAKTNWPELAIINKSLDHEKNKITESVEDEQAQLAAVNKSGNAIEFIKNPSEQVQLTAVNKSGFAIQYIKNPSEQVQLAAVKRYSSAIRYIKNPSEHAQLAAVKNNGCAIDYIENPSEQVKLAAVNQSGYAIRYIENPSEQVQLAAVKQNGFAIDNIDDPSINVLNKCKHEIIKSILTDIKDSEFELASQLIQKAAKADWPELEIIKRSLDHEKNRITESVEDEQAQLAAVNRDGWAIRYIKNPSEQVQLAAVKQNGNAIQFIENPSEQVQLAAVIHDGSAIEYIKNPSEQVQLAAVKQYRLAIRYIENPSEQVQLAAVNKDGYAIQHIKNPSEQVQLAAVKQYGRAIRYIENPSESVQIAAVEQDGYVIQYIENPCEQVQLAAVKKDGWAIQYIKNPSEQVQIAAVKQSGWAIQYIKNPSEQVQIAAVKQDGGSIYYIKNLSIYLLNKCKHEIIKAILIYIKDSEFTLASQLLQKAAKTNWPELAIINKSLDHEKNRITESVEDEQAQIAAVNRYVNAIRYIKNPSEPVQIAAVNRDGYAIRHIKNPSEQVQIAAVKQNSNAIRYIKNPSEQVQIAAVKQDGNAIDYIKNPSEPVQLAAVKQYGRAIRYIENPSEQVQIAAVNQNGWAIEYIKNPSEQIQLAAVEQDGEAIRFINDPSIYVLNKCKHEIIKAILIGLKDSEFELASKLTQKVAKTNWPELEIIKRSLDHEKNKITESVEDEQAQLDAVNRDGWAIRFINNPSEQVQIAAVEQDGFAIQYIKHPREQVQLAAVKQDTWALTFIKNPCEQVQLAAVNKNGNAIQFIKNPREQVQLAAVKRDGIAIRYIKNPSEQVQLAAVEQSSRALTFIKNPSEQVQIAAVKQYVTAIRFINDPSIYVLNKCKREIIKTILIYIKDSEFTLASQLLQKAAKTNWPELAIIKRSLDHEKNKITESVEDEQAQLAAVNRDGWAIRFIKNPSEQVQIAAVEQDGSAIEFIKNPSESVQLATVKKDGGAIYYIKNPSEQVQLAAVEQDGYAIHYIENPREQVQLAAVNQNGNAIQFIENPSERLQLAAVNRSGWAIQYITNPSEQVQLAAVNQTGTAIEYIRNPSEPVQLAAVNKDGLAIRHIKNPSEQAQIAAVKQYVTAIRFINDPSIYVLNKCKHEIIKAILIGIRDGTITSFNNWLIQLVKPINWPELEIIKLSLDHNQRSKLARSRNLNIANESVRNSNDSFGKKNIRQIDESNELHNDLNNLFHRLGTVGNNTNNITGIFHILSGLGYNNYELPNIEDKLEPYKNVILKSILTYFKKEYIDCPYNHDKDYKLCVIKRVIKVLRKFGVKWSELDMVEKSADVEEKRLLNEGEPNDKGVVWSFLRGNPMHWGHLGLVNTMIREAKRRGYDWKFFTSSKQEPEKNPLNYEKKVEWMLKLYPMLEGHIVIDPTIKTPLTAATYLYQKLGYRASVFVAGEDDMPAYSEMINKGNQHGRDNPELLTQGRAFVFDPCEFVHSDRLTSATSVRKTVADNDPQAFTRAILGPRYNEVSAEMRNAIETEMFNDVKQGMYVPAKPVKKKPKASQ